MGTTDMEKCRLVTEICFISKRTIWCTHSRNRSSLRAPFIDWYRVLGVDENSGADVIRKRYHKLALQLHPDKNKHPKAEFAFKLVSEAYTCLSDAAKRRAFDSEKLRNFCWECKRIPYVTMVPSPTTTTSPSPNPNTGPEPRRKIRGLDEVKVRFREEARVIENCLRASAVLRRELANDPSCDGQFGGKLDRLRACKESPIFDPAHYLFDGYPHLRTRVKNVSSGEFWGFQGMGSSGCGQRIGTKKSDSPIFMGMAGRGLARSRSSCVRS